MQRLAPPTRTRDTRAPRPTSIRLGKELREWLEKAAYQEGYPTLGSFIRYAARKEADRIMGYNRNLHRQRAGEERRRGDR